MTDADYIDFLAGEAAYWQLLARADYVAATFNMNAPEHTIRWQKLRARSSAMARQYLFKLLDVKAMSQR